MSNKKQQIGVFWGEAIKVSEVVKKELSLLLNVAIDDNRLQEITKAFKEASNLQRHINHQRQFTLSYSEHKKTLSSIQKALTKIDELIDKLPRETERRLDNYIAFSNDGDMSFHEIYYESDKERQSGFHLNIIKMKKAIELYQLESKEHSRENHRFTPAIKGIGKHFNRVFPQYSLPEGKQTSDESVFTRLIDLWLNELEGANVNARHRVELAFNSKIWRKNDD